MRIFGVDPGIANFGWAVVKVDEKQTQLLGVGVFAPESHRQTTIRMIKTRAGGTKRKREPVPGSLSTAENDTQRCGQIFEFVVKKLGELDVDGGVAIEDRTVNAAWAGALKMAQSGVLVAIECARLACGFERRDLIPVKDVHFALGVKVPRGVDPKQLVESAVRAEITDCSLVEAINPKSLRVHVYDAIAVILAATRLEYARLYQRGWHARSTR